MTVSGRTRKSLTPLFKNARCFLIETVLCFRFQKNFEMVSFKGTIVSMGAASGALEPFDPRRLLQKNVKYVYPS